MADFNYLKSSFFPRGGSVKKLGVSRLYLDEILSQNILPPSPSLLFRLNKEYDVPISLLLGDDFLSKSIDHPLLFSSEKLSFNSKFISDISKRFGGDQNYVAFADDWEKCSALSELVSQHYSSLNVAGRLANVLLNFSSYFSSLSSDFSQEVPAEFEFNYEDGVFDPRVCENKRGISFDEFLDVSVSDSKVTFSLKDHFLTRTVIKSISTDTDNWLPLFVDGSRRTSEKGNEFNKVLVEYKKDVPQSVLDSLRSETDFSYNNLSFNSDFFLLSNRGGLVLFDESLLLSKPDVAGRRSLYLKNRPAFSLESDRVVGFYFYPQERETHSISSSAANRFYPGPATLFLANRFQNYMENRL